MKTNYWKGHYSLGTDQCLTASQSATYIWIQQSGHFLGGWGIRDEEPYFIITPSCIIG